jgi:hypothetical protein
MLDAGSLHPSGHWSLVAGPPIRPLRCHRHRSSPSRSHRLADTRRHLSPRRSPRVPPVTMLGPGQMLAATPTVPTLSKTARPQNALSSPYHSRRLPDTRRRLLTTVGGLEVAWASSCDSLRFAPRIAVDTGRPPSPLHHGIATFIKARNSGRRSHRTCPAQCLAIPQQFTQ